MRNLKQKRVAFFIYLTGIFVICLVLLFETARSSNNQISITKETDFILDPDPDKGYTHDPNEIYNNVMVKIIPYKTFRLGFKLLMEDNTTLWIYYAPTSLEPTQYESGNIHIGLDAALIDSNIHIIDRDINLDLENFLISELRAIEKVEIVGERFDLYYIIAYRELNDGSQIKITIDNFNDSSEGLTERGWKSTSSMDQFSIDYDSSFIGYLKAKYIPETTEEDPNDTEETPYYYMYPYGGYYGSSLYGGYYGSGYYGSGYYGSSYYGGGYYGGGYYGGGYYGGGYYGGGYYGGGYYGGGYYGGGYYGGLYGGMGYYGGLYGGMGAYGGLLGLYGGLYGGLSTYYGGPIGLLGGLTGLFI
ncbi:MAG: hypothetical protein ACMUIU_15495 [bacterium]